MSTAEIEVHSEDLQRIVSVLDGPGRTLFGHASDLATAPDAGSSSDEVGSALGSLSAAVAGLAQHIGSLAESTAAASSDFTGTDGAVGGTLQQPLGGLGR